MASYLHPGVYIEEIPSGSKPIEGVSTSTAAFIGSSFRGSVNTPTLIGTWDEYVQLFGDYTQSSGVEDDQDAMALAVRAFYQNGGKAAYICRVHRETAAAVSSSAMLQNTTPDPDVDILTVTASSEGDWGDDLRIAIVDNTSSFELHVGTGDFLTSTYEVFKDLSLDPGDDNFVEKIINDGSNLIQVSVEDGVTDFPDADTVDGNGDFTSATALTGGTNTAPTAANYLTFYDNVLRKYNDISIILLPGQHWPVGGGNDFITNTITHCESTMSRMLILDPPLTPELKTGADVTTLVLPTSTYSTLYYPWVEVSNPLYHVDSNPTASKTLTIPPSSIAAALWARTDNKRGIWKAPAGVETRINVSGLQYKVEDLEQDGLNPTGVNCIRNRPGYGPVLWGSRTLATKASPEWRYIPVRRTAIFIEQSIYNGIQWSVFEANDDPLWSALRANIGSFMNGLFRAGAFQGATADDAYFVRCGKGDTMTQGDIDRGQVIVVVGFAPLKPAEFVILRIQQKVDQQ